MPSPIKPRPNADPDATYVYIIACGDLVKIGVSNHPENRLKSMRTGMPYPPHIVATKLFPTRKKAFAMELRLHWLFGKHRSNGEWFRVNANHAARALKNVHAHNPRTAGRVVAEAFESARTEPELF